MDHIQVQQHGDGFSVLNKSTGIQMRIDDEEDFVCLAESLGWDGFEVCEDSELSDITLGAREFLIELLAE